MEEILKKLDEISARISGIEKRVEKVEALAIATSQKVISQTQAAPAVQITQAAQVVIAPKKENKGIESYIGQWGAGIIGIIAIIFGGSFFLKWAFENNLIGYTGRVILGLAAGLAFIVAGEFMRKRQNVYSYILSATGLGLLYLSTYAAYGYYNLIDNWTSFFFMTLVTIFGMTLALWSDALPLALLTMAVGFLVPYIFGNTVIGDLGYFIYTLCLNLGILCVSFFKKWYPLAILGMAGTIAHFGNWHALYYDQSKLGITIFALTSFYLIYLAIGNLMSYSSGPDSDIGELFVLTINPLWFFFWLYDLLSINQDNNTMLAFISVALALVYIILTYSSQKIKGVENKLPMFLGGIAATFLTIAIPLQFNGSTITVAWATEALIISLIGSYVKNEKVEKLSLLIFALTLIRLINFDTGITEEDLLTFVPILNRRFLTYLAVTLSGTGIAYLSSHMTDEEYRSGNAKLIAVTWIIVNILILSAVTNEISYFFEREILTTQKTLQVEMGSITSYPASYNQNYYGALQNSPEIKSAENQKNALTSIFWTLYSILLVSLGIMFKEPFLRWGAIVLFTITIIKVFLVDLYALSTIYKVASLMILGLILLLVSYLYFKHEKSIDKK